MSVIGAPQASRCEVKVGASEQIEELVFELEKTQAALDRVSRSSRTPLAVTVPELAGRPPDDRGWNVCVRAMEVIDAVYPAKHGFKTCLRSNFVDRSECHESKKQSREIDSLLAGHAARLFPRLPGLLRGGGDDGDQPRRVLLLLEAPSYGTTKALCAAVPGLAAALGNVCVPQADPIHYAAMVADPKGLLLNVRCQRLDEWLCANSGLGLKVPIFFADFECSCCECFLPC